MHEQCREFPEGFLRIFSPHTNGAKGNQRPLCERVVKSLSTFRLMAFFHAALSSSYSTSEDNRCSGEGVVQIRDGARILSLGNILKLLKINWGGGRGREEGRLL